MNTNANITTSANVVASNNPITVAITATEKATMAMTQTNIETANAYGNAIRTLDRKRSLASNLFLTFAKEGLIPLAQSNIGVGTIIEACRQFYSSAFPKGVNQAMVNDVKNSSRQGLDLVSALTGGQFTFRQGQKGKDSSYRPFVAWTPAPEATAPEAAAPEAAPAITMDRVIPWLAQCNDAELTGLRSAILDEMKRRADTVRAQQRELAKAAKAAREAKEAIAA